MSEKDREPDFESEGAVNLSDPPDELMVLPLRDTAAGNEWVFPEPEAEEPWQTETLRAGHNIRRSETDLSTGAVHLVIEDDFGKRRDADHGLIAGTIARERWSIHPDNPTSARGECHWTTELEREGIRLRTETTCAMWSDAETFHLTARLEAYENDELVYDRDVRDTIARDNL